MVFVPVSVNGRTRLMPMDDVGERSFEKALDTDARLMEVSRRRQYATGSQYDAENWKTAQDCKLDPRVQRVPEHMRLHAYSTQIGESVNFISDQLSEGFRLKAKDKEVQAVIDAAIEATTVLTGGDGDEQLAVDDVIREAGIAGDVAYEVRWDPFEETAFVEFWESEQVEFDVPFGESVQRVWRTDQIWIKDERGDDRQVTERVRWSLARNERGVKECLRETFYDNEDEPRKTEWLGLPMVPWMVLRADKRSLRGFRGDSLITSQAMETADRLNAVEQLSYLIARYNSHGNLVIIGDGAAIGVAEDGLVHKDVADVLKFPGGTKAEVITLPTNPQMIIHQREVCADAIYSSFGLTRVEPSTIQGLGAVSGYALEILNRKSEGTFRRVRRTFRKDFLKMLNLILDVTAYRRDASIGLIDGESGIVLEEFTLSAVRDPAFEFPEGLIPVVLFEGVNPADVFENRAIDIQMASGYIVDAVAVRDDFTAKMISQQEALRQRGYTEPQIQQIMGEMEAAAPQEGTQLSTKDLLTAFGGTSRNEPQAGQQDTARA